MIGINSIKHEGSQFLRALTGTELDAIRPGYEMSDLALELITVKAKRAKSSEELERMMRALSDNGKVRFNIEMKAV